MKTIINHYGLAKQKRKFAEENLELQEAITEYQMALRRMEGRSPEDVEVYMANYRDHIKEELADNFVMLGEFMAFFGITNTDIEPIARFKIKRTHNQIEEEKMGNEISRKG